MLDKLGGASALKAVVDEFYERIIADGDLAVFFENTSMEALKMHQMACMKIAFTKIPKHLDVPKLIKIDKGLNASHFDRVAGHLIASLESLNVPSNLTDECVNVVAPLWSVFE